MRRLRLLCLLLAVAAAALPRLAAQQASVPDAPAPQWQTVQTLPVGSLITVRQASGSVACRFKSATQNALTCIRDGDLSIGRGDIRRIDKPNRGASTGMMAAVGAGVGLVTVVAVSKAIGFGGSAKGSVYAGGAGIGAVFFAPIGFFTHPIHSTIYKAP